MTPCTTGTATTTGPFWRIVVTDSFGYTLTVWDSNGRHVAQTSWQPVYNYGPPAEPPPSEFKSLYQVRLERSLAAIAQRAREARRWRPQNLARHRQRTPFARRTCALSSRWMVSQ